MKKNMDNFTNTSFYFLRGIIQLSLMGTFLNLLFMLIIEFTSVELKWGSFSINPHNKNGYSIPVDITVNNLPDTSIIVSVKRPAIEYSESFSVRNFGKQNYKTVGYDTLINDTSAKIRMELNRWVAIPMDNMRGSSGKNNYELFANEIKHSSIDVSFQAIKETVQIKAKGKNKWQNFLLAFDSYFNVLIWLVILYNLMLIFETIKKKLSFVNTIHKRVNIIGFTLIISQVILFLFSFVYLKIFGSITLATARPEGEYYSGIQVQFNPTNSGSFNYFLLGLILIVLSLIFKYGQKIETENSLTI